MKNALGARSLRGLCAGLLVGTSVVLASLVGGSLFGLTGLARAQLLDFVPVFTGPQNPTGIQSPATDLDVCS